MKNPKKVKFEPKRIRDALRKRGSSLNAWASERGYRPRSVYAAVTTWGGRTDKEPLGGITRAIMADLRADLGPNVVPAQPPRAK